MGRVCGQQDSPHPEALGTALVDLVRAEVPDIVLARLGRAGNELPVLPRLPLEHLFTREIALFSVRDAEHPIIGDLSDHGEVVRVDDKVGSIPVEFLELRVKHLWMRGKNERETRQRIGREGGGYLDIRWWPRSACPM